MKTRHDNIWHEFWQLYVHTTQTNDAQNIQPVVLNLHCYKSTFYYLQMTFFRSLIININIL